MATDLLSKTLQDWSGARLRIVTAQGEFHGAVRDAGEWLVLVDTDGHETAVIRREHVIAAGLMDMEYASNAEFESWEDEPDDDLPDEPRAVRLC